MRFNVSIFKTFSSIYTFMNFQMWVRTGSAKAMKDISMSLKSNDEDGLELFFVERVWIEFGSRGLGKGCVGTSILERSINKWVPV